MHAATVPQTPIYERHRKPREDVVPPWPLTRQGKAWSDAEKEALRRRWTDKAMSMDTLAAAHGRTITSCRLQACKMDLGFRPKEQSFGAHLRGQPRAPRRTADERPVELKPTYDGVVMTKRLRAAWDRVIAGGAIPEIAREMRLTAVEVAALRRWSQG